MPLIPILRRSRLEDPEYKASLGYIARTLPLKKKNQGLEM